MSEEYSKNVSMFFNGEHLVPNSLDDLPCGSDFFPHGWMTPLELQLLYNFGKYGKGSFLEIGTWIGRSTVAIAMGLRDSLVRGRIFDAVDYGFVSLDDFCRDLSVGMEYASTDEIARPILGHGGSIAHLIENLRERKLLEQVTSVVRGNAVAVPLRDSYEVIFCDAVHSEREIDIIGPTLQRVTKSGSWLIMDDIHDHDHLVSAIEKYVGFDFVCRLAATDKESKVAVGLIK